MLFSKKKKELVHVKFPPPPASNTGLRWRVLRKVGILCLIARFHGRRGGGFKLRWKLFEKSDKKKNVRGEDARAHLFFFLFLFG
jgi:hypothetical protein